MKAAKILFGILTLVLISVYVVLFTSVNKTILVPIIKDNIVKASKIDDVKVDKFELNINSLNMVILLNNQKIKVDSTFSLLSQDLDLNYDLFFSDLSIFNKISGQKLQGTFKTSGKIDGKFNNINIDGSAFVADGDIKYNLNISNNDINNIVSTIKNVKIEKLLYTISQPEYAKANLDLKIKIKSLNNLDGTIVTTLYNGILNKKLVKNDFNISLPTKPIFNVDATTVLNKNIITTKSSFKTFVANINTSKTIFDTKTSILTTDYSIIVPKLSSLYFLTKQKMRGDIKIDGNIKFKDDLTVSFNSKKFDGKIDGTFIKNKIKLNLKDINSVELLNMMYYPEIYKSKIALDLNYDIKTKKGISSLVMTDGKFLTNKLSKIIKKFIKKDLTKELYKIAKIDTKIDDKKLDSKLLMTSKNSKISSDKFFVDLDKGQINSDINMKYFKYEIALNLNGDLKKPKVKIDTNKLIKSKVKSKIQNVIDKKLGDKLDDKTKKVLGNFLNKLF